MSLPEITALCRVLARSDARDSSEQGRNFQRLTELREYLRPHADPGMTACLDATTALMDALRDRGMIGHEELLGIVCKLMAVVEKNWSGADPDAAIAATLYGEPDDDVLPEPEPEDEDEDRKIESRIAGAKTAVFKVGDIEEAQNRIEQLKRTPRINEMVLGELLVELGHLTQDEIDAALTEQEQTGELLGEILLSRGSVQAHVITDTVRLQVQLRAESTVGALAHPPEPAPPLAVGKSPRTSTLRLAGEEAKRLQSAGDDNTLGELLIRQGAITRDELERAVSMKRASGLRLGETLVEMHVAGWETINRAIELQRRLRSAAGLPKRISF